MLRGSWTRLQSTLHRENQSSVRGLLCLKRGVCSYGLVWVCCNYCIGPVGKASGPRAGPVSSLLPMPHGFLTAISSMRYRQYC